MTTRPWSATGRSPRHRSGLHGLTRAVASTTPCQQTGRQPGHRRRRRHRWSDSPRPYRNRPHCRHACHPPRRSPQRSPSRWAARRPSPPHSASRLQGQPVPSPEDLPTESPIASSTFPRKQHPNHPQPNTGSPTTDHRPVRPRSRHTARRGALHYQGLSPARIRNRSSQPPEPDVPIGWPSGRQQRHALVSPRSRSSPCYRLRRCTLAVTARCRSAPRVLPARRDHCG